MTVGNEKLFKSRRRRTQKVKPSQGRRGVEGSATAGQLQWSIEIQRDFSISKPFLSMQNNGREDEESFLFCVLHFANRNRYNLNAFLFV